VNTVLTGTPSLDRHLEIVRNELSVAFPEVEPAVVATMVDRCRRAYAEARIREFVPLLVARRVRAELVTFLTEGGATR